MVSAPADAIASGIGMVHQHFMLVPTQSATENILLGPDEPLVCSWPVTIKSSKPRPPVWLQVDPRSDLALGGEQQRVEILKTLYRGLPF
jgi:simple sugar transport system ATP-binding protein